MSLTSVPLPESFEPEAQLALFEGLTVHRSRIAAGSVPEFAGIDADNQTVTLVPGDVVVLQIEAIVTSVEHGTSFKGGVQVKAMDRIHHGKILDGTQQVVAVRRRGE